MTPQEFATQICLDLGIMDKEAPAELGDWLAMRLLADRCLHLPPQKGDPKECSHTVQDEIAPIDENEIDLMKGSDYNPDFIHSNGACSCISALKKDKCNPCRSAKDGHASDCWSKAHKKDSIIKPSTEEIPVSCPCSFQPQCDICVNVVHHSPKCLCGEVKYTPPSLSEEQSHDE